MPSIPDDGKCVKNSVRLCFTCFGTMAFSFSTCDVTVPARSWTLCHAYHLPTAMLAPPPSRTHFEPSQLKRSTVCMWLWRIFISSKDIITICNDHPQLLHQVSLVDISNVLSCPKHTLLLCCHRGRTSLWYDLSYMCVWPELEALLPWKLEMLSTWIVCQSRAFSLTHSHCYCIRAGQVHQAEEKYNSTLWKSIYQCTVFQVRRT